MARLTYEQLNLIKEKLGVDALWSFSKFSTYTQCSHAYKLKYIDKIRVDGANCYNYWGTNGHEIYQDFTDGKIKYHEMIEVFEDMVLKYLSEDKEHLRFPAVKNSTSEDQRDKYLENLRHFFKNTKPLPYNIISEKFVMATFHGATKYVFQGYIDGEYVDDEGNLVILDYKTSSINGFTGEKLLEKARQLMIYAIGISQLGRVIDGERKHFPINKIKVRYNMLKYCTINFPQKNGKIGSTRAERRVWVGKIANKLRKDLEEGTELDIFEINELIEQATAENSLDCMPQFVQDKYVVSDHYIDVPLDEQVIEKFKGELVDILDAITKREQEEDKEQAFTRERVTDSNSYFCQNLCDMKEHCKFWQEYKQHQSMFIKEKEEKQMPQSDDELLALLGL